MEVSHTIPTPLIAVGIVFHFVGAAISNSDQALFGIASVRDVFGARCKEKEKKNDCI